MIRYMRYYLLTGGDRGVFPPIGNNLIDEDGNKLIDELSNESVVNYLIPEDGGTPPIHELIITQDTLEDILGQDGEPLVTEH
jgi:hypothetical protein